VDKKFSRVKYFYPGSPDTYRQTHRWTERERECYAGRGEDRQMKGEGKRVRWRKGEDDRWWERGGGKRDRWREKISFLGSNLGHGQTHGLRRGEENQIKGRGRATDKGEGNRVRSRETGREVDEGRGEESQMKERGKWQMMWKGKRDRWREKRSVLGLSPGHRQTHGWRRREESKIKGRGRETD
jgi:hypothetical protein